MSEFGQSNVHSTRRDPSVGRLKVDVSNTAFWEGKEYRIDREIIDLGGTPLVLKFTCAKDFILQKQGLTCDVGGIRFRAYREGQGTEGGTFGTAVPIYKVNFMTSTPDVPTSTTITTGGTFTPSAPAVETIRVVTSNATSGQSTVSGAVGDERGLAAGTYYLLFDNIAQSGSSTGVFTLSWEERN